MLLDCFSSFSLSHTYVHFYIHTLRGKQSSTFVLVFYWCNFLFKQNLTEEFRTVEAGLRQVYFVP